MSTGLPNVTVREENKYVKEESLHLQTCDPQRGVGLEATRSVEVFVTAKSPEFDQHHRKS